jgi:hypothetical protein
MIDSQDGFFSKPVPVKKFLFSPMLPSLVTTTSFSKYSYFYTSYDTSYAYIFT